MYARLVPENRQQKSKLSRIAQYERKSNVNIERSSEGTKKTRESYS